MSSSSGICVINVEHRDNTSSKSSSSRKNAKARNNNNINNNNDNNNNDKNNNDNNKNNNASNKRKKTNKTSLTSKKQSSSLKCFYTNATSLNTNKLAELQVKANTNNYDLIFISETWFNELSVPSLVGYSVHRKDRASLGGGVCIYVKDGLEIIDIPDADLNKILAGNHSEQIWKCVINGDEQILIGCIYRAPPGLDKDKNAQIESEIIKSIYNAKKSNDSNKFNGLVVAGDFNFPYIEWDSDGVASLKGSQNSPGVNFLRLLNDEFISQNVTDPTFKQANGECKNVLDLVLTDIPERISNVSTGSPLGTTDQAHLSITWETNINKQPKTRFSSKKYCYSKGNYINLKNDIESVDWYSKLTNLDVKSAYVVFTDEYKKLCEKSIPKMKQVKLKPIAPWVTDQIINLSAKKDRLFYQNRASKWKIQSLVREYEKIRREIKKESKKATITFEQRLANDKKNPKLLYAYVNSRQKVKDSINAMRNKNNEVTNDKKK